MSLMMYGIFARGDTVHVPWWSAGGDGSSAAPSANGTARIRRVSDGEIRTDGISPIISVGGIVGINRIDIDLDDDFYDIEGDYALDVLGLVVDGATINKTLWQFKVGTVIVPATLTAEERAAAADAFLDRAAAVDGQTVRRALQIMAAILAGKVTGAGTGIESFTGIDGATPRVEVTTDAAGNRSHIDYSS